MKLLLRLLINTVSVFVAAKIVSGIELNSIETAFIVAIVLGVLNTFIKPILIILTLPINIITLGLFTFIINGFLVLLVSYFVPGFVVATLISALLFSILLSLISAFLGMLLH